MRNQPDCNDIFESGVIAEAGKVASAMTFQRKKSLQESEINKCNDDPEKAVAVGRDRWLYRFLRTDFGFRPIV